MSHVLYFWHFNSCVCREYILPNMYLRITIPDNKAHGANMGPIWGRQDPSGPHVGSMNFALWDDLNKSSHGDTSLKISVDGIWLYDFNAWHLPRRRLRFERVIKLLKGISTQRIVFSTLNHVLMTQCDAIRSHPHHSFRWEAFRKIMDLIKSMLKCSMWDKDLVWF